MEALFGREGAGRAPPVLFGWIKQKKQSAARRNSGAEPQDASRGPPPRGAPEQGRRPSPQGRRGPRPPKDGLAAAELCFCERCPACRLSRAVSLPYPKSAHRKGALLQKDLASWHSSRAGEPRAERRQTHPQPLKALRVRPAQCPRKQASEYRRRRSAPAFPRRGAAIVRLLPGAAGRSAAFPREGGGAGPC